MIQLLVPTFIIVLLAVAGLGIKMLFDKKAEFSGGSCQASSNSKTLQEKGLGCGCGDSCETE